jgi:hypothetical protein
MRKNVLNWSQVLSAGGFEIQVKIQTSGVHEGVGQCKDLCSHVYLAAGIGKFHAILDLLN